VEKKKKRTILMSEDPSEVTPPSLASKVKSFASDVAGKFHGVKGGLGVQTGPAEFSMGVIKSEAMDSLGKRKGKTKLGAKVKFEF
jgi:hypothetical protein